MISPSSVSRLVRVGCTVPALLARLRGGRNRRSQSRRWNLSAASVAEPLEDKTLLSVTIAGTFDFFITDPGETDIDLGTDPAGDNPPLPPGFFGAIGTDPSDPFAQAGIPLEGNPPVEDFERFPPPMRIAWVDQHGNEVGPDSSHKVNAILVPANTRFADTVISRNDDAVFNGVGEAPTVDIEIVALSLKSVDPIVVTYGTSGVKLWDVFVTLDETAVQPVGSLDLTSDTFVDGVSVSGSVDNLDLPVAFKVTFQEVNNAGNVREVPSTLANPTPPFGLPPAQFTNTPGTFSFPLNAVVAEKHDTLVGDVDGDVDGDGEADPGDTLEYNIGIGNFTGDDLTNVMFSDTLVDSTLVSGSINVSPLAIDDTFSTFGNFMFDSAAVGAPGLLDNDREFLTDVIGVGTLVTDFDATSAQGGNVSVNPNGTFTYEPALGFTGLDTFTYDVADSGGLSDTAVVEFNVGSFVWFIDSVNGSDAGNGTFESPFKTPVPLSGIVSVGGPGDIIYVLDDGGAGTDGGLVLKDDQQLWGQGVPLELGVTIFVPATNRPTIGSAGTDAINLASGNTVRGLNINSTSGAGITGLNVGGLIIDEVHVTASGGSGVDLRNGTGVDLTFDGLTVSNISDPGLPAVWFGDLGGNVSVLGDTTITDVEGLGFAALGSAELHLDHGGHLTVSNIGSSGVDGVSIDLDPASTVDFNGGVDITTTNGGDGLAIFSTGVVQIPGSTSRSNSTGGAAVRVANTMIGLTFDSITSDGGDTGISLGNVTGDFTVVGNTVIDNKTGPGVTVGNSSVNLTFESIDINGADVGISLNGTTGSFTITGDGGTVQNGSGGTIQNTSGNGINLNNARNAVIHQMSFFNLGGDAINSVDTEDLNVSHSTATGISGNGFVSQAFAAGPIQQTVRWINNDVTSEFVSFFASTDLPLLNVQAVGNAATALSATFAVSGLFVTSDADGANICLDLRDTTAVATLGAPGIGLNQQPGSAGFGLDDFTGDGTDAGVVAAFVASKKPGTAGVQATVGNGFTTCTVPAALMASLSPAVPVARIDGAPETSDAENPAAESLPLTNATLTAIVDAAIGIWEESGLTTAQSAALNATTYEIADLGDLYLGTVTGTHLKIDADGGGRGWFVDPTPFDDSEFTADSSPAGFDLLTTVVHEMGHVLGLADLSTGNNVMSGVLTPGERRLPTVGQATDAEPGGVTSTEYIGSPQDLGTLPAGKTLTIVFQAIIDTLTATQTQISNQGMVTADGGISVLTDDPATAATNDPTVTRVPQVDLEITKTDTVDAVPAGDAFSYEVTVTNNGPSTAEAVVITDTLPAGVTWVSDDGPNVAPNAGLLLWEIGNLANGPTVVWTINVTANADAFGTTQSNTAVVSTRTNDTDGTNDAVSEDTVFTGGAIHGYKFEDLNVNGVDDDEPKLAGVEVHLDDGTNIVTVRTDANGGYWFMGLDQGHDTVTERIQKEHSKSTADPNSQWPGIRG